MVPGHPRLNSAMIYAEMLSAVGARLVEIAGPAAALGFFSQAAKPVGERDAKRMAPLLGAGYGNAASAAFVEYAIIRMLGLVPNFVSLGPGSSEVSVRRCRYGDAVVRYRHPFVCAMCVEYNRGIAKAFGAEFTPGDASLSKGGDSCTGRMVVPNPSDVPLPSFVRMRLVVLFLGAMSGRNSLTVSTLSSVLAGLGERISRGSGPEASLIAARGAFEAGKCQVPLFSGSLALPGGLEGAPQLVSAVREALGCRMRIRSHAGGFSVSTRNCPHLLFCSPGNFIETVCSSYSKGLLSGTGEFRVVSRSEGDVCVQDFGLSIVPRA